MPLSWTFEADVTIPPEAEGDLRFAELSPWEVGADSDGRIYALDSSGGRVVVFGRSGRVVGTVGSPGEGPGELSEPTALAVSSGGEVAVYDFGAGGIKHWGSAGGLPALRRLDAVFWGPDLEMASWGFIYPSIAADGREGRVLRLRISQKLGSPGKRVALI